MGLEVLNKKIFEVTNDINLQEDYFNISDLVIPFSTIFKNSNPLDVYTGEETIPFHKRDSNFKQILLNEFLFEN